MRREAIAATSDTADSDESAATEKAKVSFFSMDTPPPPPTYCLGQFVRVIFNFSFFLLRVCVCVLITSERRKGHSCCPMIGTAVDIASIIRERQGGSVNSSL